MNWATFYLVCFVVGFALSVIMLFSGVGHHRFAAKWHLPRWGHSGLHHGGLGHVAVGHTGVTAHPGAAGGHGSTGKGSAQYSPFDVSTFMAFLAWFGGTGYLLTRYSGIWDIFALGIAGFTGRGWATITELAEFLQERHNAVVGLVQRAERCRLVRKEQGPRDRRLVRVHLLPKGEKVLAKLTELHQKEVKRFQLGILNAPK